MGPLIILIPIFNDWAALDLLLYQVDRISNIGRPVHVVVIDDGSAVQPGAGFCASPFSRLETVNVVRLRRNLGHQRAISVGLVYVYENYPDGITVVMDGDGEDKPDDIGRLVNKLEAEQGGKIIFAERAKRTETLGFRIAYHLYRFAHYALTGISIRAGNFSIVPYSALSGLVVTAEIWNHYAAAVYSARFPHASIVTTRGTRLSGKSKMNFLSLVIHGLSAISVYSDRVGIRLLTVSAMMILLVGAGLLMTVAVRFDTPFTIPGWGGYVSGLLAILLLQAVMMSFIFAFISLNSRSRPSFIPLRDCPYFIGAVQTVFPKP